MSEQEERKAAKQSRIRKRAKAVKPFRCRHTIAVLEDPRDILNLGTVIRNVDALGIEKVYVVDPYGKLPDDWEDLRERRSVMKTSSSASKWVFVKRFNSTAECHAHLKKNGFRSVVTSPHVKGKTSLYLDEVDFTQFNKLAIWFGTEGGGITDEAVQKAELCVAIPMFGMIESLNLGTSSGIVLYEVAKQRRAYQSRFSKKNFQGRRSTPLPTVPPMTRGR
jgi:tRNA (guanosine-2'-O-)-methyltransferase